jgi:hypothetical protein
MRDYDVGYGKPPKHSRFKKGVCPNPRGRGKTPGFQLSEAILRVMTATVAFREKGCIRRASRSEVAIRKHIAAALEGDIASATHLLRIRQHGLKYGDPGPLIINLVNSPDRQAARRSDSTVQKGEDIEFNRGEEPL